MMRSLLQKSTSSAQDFCERYLVENTNPESTRLQPCKRIKFRTVAYVSTPYKLDARPTYPGWAGVGVASLVVTLSMAARQSGPISGPA